MFDEADLDAALGLLRTTAPQAPRLENAASQVDERLLACFGARNWDAMADMMADDYYQDDRRRVVNVGLRQGRDVAIAAAQETAELDVRSEVVATRGERLFLGRAQWSGPDQEPEAFHTDVLRVVETNADERIVAHVWFDVDDFDAAFAELDARYLAGEAATHAHTWSVVAKACSALNRRELFSTTPDWVNIDHRQGIAFAPGDLTAYVRSAWDLLSDGGVYIETAHRLSNLGAVVTWTGHASSREGSHVEFRGFNVLAVKAT